MNTEISSYLSSLVCGDVEGRLNQLFKRASNVNQKNGPFAMLLCVGDFFGTDNSQWLPYKKGDLKGNELLIFLYVCVCVTYHTFLRIKRNFFFKCMFACGHKWPNLF